MIKPRLGFIGIGVMGRPMATHLANAGYEITVHDVNRAKAEEAATGRQTMRVADTPLEVAEASDTVITMLPSGQYVREVTMGESGLIKGLKSGSLLIDTSSSEAWLTRQTAAELKEYQIDMIDAPVSGAESGAKAAELIFMVGGEPSSVFRATPLLDIMGKQVFHLGPIGAGHIMKSMNNLVTAMTFMATTEALAVGKKLGLDPNAMTDVLNVSTGMSWISQTQIKQRITSRKFDDAFKLELMVKDIGIAIGLADDAQLPVPLSAVGYHLWKAAGIHAGEDASISDMVRWVESVTKTEISSQD
jgi:3-hydroxyisobutyrate dehydrogenase-like beta-hydroxyacid dehydrogenase